MARMIVAALAALVLMGCAHQAAAGRELKAVSCPPMRCPSGYTAVDTSTTVCGYYCETSVKMNCPAGPARNARVCGGTTNKICPSIACAYSTTYAISGPNGCATAKAAVDAIAFSNVTYQPVGGVASPPILEYCSGQFTTPLDVAASNAANAFAKTVAKSLVHYNQYVCTCCLGNSNATSVIRADVQAVAIAQAQALQSLTAQVDCFGDLMSYAFAQSDAFARDVQLAINSVYNRYVSLDGFNCVPSTVQTEIKEAIAQATVCTFVQVFASAIDAQSPGITYACGAGISVSGVFPSAHTCPINLNCPCTPEGYQNNNLGLETGFFDSPAGNSVPAWIVTDDAGGLSPSVLQSQKLKIGHTTKTLLPAESEGKFFAAIPAGEPSASTISTEITVPPCAKKITMKYVFKCNSGDLSNDASTLTIKLTDKYDTSVLPFTSSQTVTCDNVGFRTGECINGGDSSVANGGATNGGDWSTFTMDVPYSGVFYLDVTAATSEVGVVLCRSIMYIDDVRFE